MEKTRIRLTEIKGEEKEGKRERYQFERLNMEGCFY